MDYSKISVEALQMCHELCGHIYPCDGDTQTYRTDEVEQ